MAECCFCGAKILKTERILRSDCCVECGSSIKVCLNCAHYEPGSHWDCGEEIQEPIADKEKLNFCEYFFLSQKEGFHKQKNSSQKARQNFNSLFKD